MAQVGRRAQLYPMSIGTAFLEQSRAFLTREYLPKIRVCVERLSEEDVWWRPNETSNAVGNLLLHLAGNVRQWIVSGVGGAPDTRRRAEEFAARGPGAISKTTALERLEAAVREVDGVLQGLDEAVLLERRNIQGRDVSVLDAVYHVVEHFAMHTGQITWITKLRTGHDLGFYRDADGLALPSWPGARPVEPPRGP